MTRLPRDVSGEQLVVRLARLGYVVVRQTGSHVRLSAEFDSGGHHLTVPMHGALRVGTLNAILTEVAARAGMSRDELLGALFDR